MKRVIKDYNSITPEHAALIEAAYPNGFENDNLVSFTTPKGEYIKALEIRTEDTIYLFKIDKNMAVADDENANDNDDVADFDGFKDGDDASSDDDEDDDADNDVADDDGDDDED